MSYTVIEGNATGDATLREFTGRNGGPVPISNVTVAVNDRRYNREAEQWEDGATVYYEVTVTGTPAAHFAASARKGVRLIAAGQMYVETSTDSEGASRSRARINADTAGISTRFAPSHTDK